MSAVHLTAEKIREHQQVLSLLVRRVSATAALHAEIAYGLEESGRCDGMMVAAHLGFASVLADIEASLGRLDLPGCGLSSQA